MDPVYAYSRFALRDGLIKKNIGAGSVILVPDYNCDVVYYPLRNIGIELKYYALRDDFTPDWNDLRSLATETRCVAVMMVHYFGQPQPIAQFTAFCKEFSLLLVEDNAHGHGGTLNGSLLGTFGDIGFSSPRKQLNLAYGGILYIDGKESPPQMPRGPLISTINIKARVVTQVSKVKPLRNLLKKKLLTRPDFSAPEHFIESEMPDAVPDTYSKRLIRKADWKQEAAARRVAWKDWSRFCISRGLQPVWDEPYSSSCPWIMPAYATDAHARERVLLAAWDAGLPLIPWPSMSEEVLIKYPRTRERWQSLVCFLLHKTVSDCSTEIDLFDQLLTSQK